MVRSSPRLRLPPLVSRLRGSARVLASTSPVPPGRGSQADGPVPPPAGDLRPPPHHVDRRFVACHARYKALPTRASLQSTTSGLLSRDKAGVFRVLRLE